MQTCPTCKTEFKNKRGARGQKYCSRSCGLVKSKITKILTCQICTTDFKFVGRTTAKYCPDCRQKATAMRAVKSAVSLGRIARPGVGSGGNQDGNTNGRGKGKKNKPLRRSSVDYRTLGLNYYGHSCGVCGDSERRLTVHHRNGDETDHRVENLIPMCYTCHRHVHYIKVPSIELEQRLTELLMGRPK